MSYTEKLRRNIFLFYIVDGLVHLEFIIPIWVAFYTRYLTFSQIALIHAVQFAIVIILELPTGALADLIGRKYTITIGWLLSAIGLIYAAFSHNFLMFFMSFMIRGIGEVMVSGSDVALFYDTLKELKEEGKFPRLMARYGFIIRMSLMVGTFFGGYVYTIWTGLPYLLLGIAHLGAAILLLFFTEPHIDSEKFTLASYVRQAKDGFKELFKTSYNRRLTLFYTLVGGITWSCLIYFNQPFAKDTGFSELEMSWLFAGGYLFAALALLWLTKHMALLTRNRVYLAFPFVMVLALLPGAVAPKIAAIAMLFLLQLAGSSRFTFLDKFTNEEFSSKYRATAISGLNMLVGIFVIVMVGISGVFQDAYNTRVIFSFLGILTLLFVVPSALGLIHHHRHATINTQDTSRL